MNHDISFCLIYNSNFSQAAKNKNIVKGENEYHQRQSVCVEEFFFFLLVCVILIGEVLLSHKILWFSTVTRMFLMVKTSFLKIVTGSG